MIKADKKNIVCVCVFVCVTLLRVVSTLPVSLMSSKTATHKMQTMYVFVIVILAAASSVASYTLTHPHRECSDAVLLCFLSEGTSYKLVVFFFLSSGSRGRTLSEVVRATVIASCFRWKTHFYTLCMECCIGGAAAWHRGFRLEGKFFPSCRGILQSSFCVCYLCFFFFVRVRAPFF